VDVRLDQTLVLVVARVALHERLADEARHVLADDGAGRLEARGRKCDEVEPRLVTRIAPE
jgi:hypothetical protein